MSPGSAEMSKSQTSPPWWHCSNWKCHHLSIMHEHGALITLLKKWVYKWSDLLGIMKSYCCSRPKWIISLFAEYSHILHATDNVIWSETIEDIYNLKIECTSESETQWCIGTWLQASISRPDSVEQLQKKKDLGLGLFLSFGGYKCSWAWQWKCSTLTHYIWAVEWVE